VLIFFSISAFLIIDLNYKQMMRDSKVFNYELYLVVTGFVEVAALTNVNADRSADVGAIRAWVSLTRYGCHYRLVHLKLPLAESNLLYV
jgi:hypothetical protein